jgi:hypothetical protein
LFGRRLLILVAVLMGLTALAASVAPPPPRGGRTPPATSPTQTPAPASADGPEPGVMSRSVDAGGPGLPVRIDVPRGHTLELTVTVKGPDSVSFGSLDVDAADVGSPAQFELYADLPGEYPLRLVEAGRRLGVVRVTG